METPDSMASNQNDNLEYICKEVQVIEDIDKYNVNLQDKFSKA